jgi:hypothetical protein
MSYIEIGGEFGPFQKVACFTEGKKLGMRDKVVLSSINLAWSRSSGGVGDRQSKVGGEVSKELPDESGFATS